MASQHMPELGVSVGVLVSRDPEASGSSRQQQNQAPTPDNKALNLR